MSRIIKANFRPVLTENGYSERQMNSQAFLSPEPNGNLDTNPRAAIVDAATVIRTAQDRAVRLLNQAEERVVELVSAAEEQTITIQEKARESGLEQGYSQGYEDGYGAGLAAAKAAAKAEMQHEMALIKQVARECQEIRSHAIAQAERDVVVLSLAIAEKIIKQKVEEQPGLTANIIKDVARRVQGEANAVIRVHPTVLESLGELVTGDELPANAASVGWELVGDASVEPGGCLLETEFGRVDASLETRFLSVSESLLQLLEGEGI